jgi:hypothetical protein
MADPDPVRTRNERLWAMSLEDLTNAATAGQVGSEDHEHVLTVLRARGIVAGVETTEATARLVAETAGLRRATWFLVAATFAAVLVALGVAIWS